MEIISGFCDLCIPYQKNHTELKETLQELCSLGYKNIAIEQVYDDTKTIAVKNVDPIPTPLDLDDLRKDFKGKLKILSRLSVIYSDAGISQKLEKSPNYKKFNILAAIPTTEVAISHACQAFNCDIITYNQASESVKLRISRKFYNVAVNRNIFFEIKYAQAIKDPDERKDTITRAHQYHMWGRSKNVIISSEARQQFDLRSPYDIANLGLIFGLSEEQSKSAILSLCRKVLLRAESRRLGKTIMIIKQVQQFGDYDASSDESEDSENSDEEMSEQPFKKPKLDDK